ncbi:MAG TPA: hypothetical protein VFZ99_03475 [Terriglobales bacterium]
MVVGTGGATAGVAGGVEVLEVAASVPELVLPLVVLLPVLPAAEFDAEPVGFELPVAAVLEAGGFNEEEAAAPVTPAGGVVSALPRPAVADELPKAGLLPGGVFGSPEGVACAPAKAHEAATTAPARNIE